MKTVLLIFACSLNIFAQQILDGCAPELYITTKNFPQGISTSVTIENTSPLYCFIDNQWNLCSNCDINPTVIVDASNSSPSNAKGWTICFQDRFNDCRNIDNYGYSLYKISESLFG